ncbi:MAG: tRNA threonylcarbamoyladenosine dehydratase [Oscillospiraceae bacterium]|nr:tRNA threonylcarbamoyladenosine dehydratase [Oscillospiraceae bacterium]
MENQFIREEMILGQAALQRLHGAHVAVFGIGGVGSYCVEALARAGVGQLTLIDNDTVSFSNLNRQLEALHSTIGQYKSDVMAARVRDIFPNCVVRSVPQLYTEETKSEFFDRHYDYIVDAIDLVSCKISLIMTAMAQNIPIISSMGTGNKLDPTQFRITDISQSQVCPLARIMRRELRQRGVLHHTVLWSTEPPAVPAALEAPPPGRHMTPASVAWVPSCAGLMLGGYVVQALLNE